MMQSVGAEAHKAKQVCWESQLLKSSPDETLEIDAGICMGESALRGSEAHESGVRMAARKEKQQGNKSKPCPNAELNLSII